MTMERRRMSRARILDGAIDILDAGVYGDLTVDALSRSLHMSKSTLYKYFASKDDVVIALISNACQATEDALGDIDLSRLSAPEGLDAIVEVLADHADRMPRAAVLQHARLPAACQNRMQLSSAALGQAFHAVLQDGSTTGVFGVADPALVSTAFMAGAMAGMQASARGEIESSRGEAVRDLLAIFQPGLTRAVVAA